MALATHRKRLVPLLAVVALSCGKTAGQCRPDNPSGYFEGTATSKQAGKLDVSLNLRCEGSSYRGELITSVGTYSIEGGTVQSDRLRLQLAAGTDRVSLDLQIEGGVLRGTFDAGEDAGPVELRRTGEAKSPGSLIPTLDLSKQQWHEDLAFYAKELPNRHVNAFHFVSREQFDAEVDALDHRIDHSSSDAIFTGLVRIASSVGDGHTHFEPPEDVAAFPISFRRFGNAYRVSAIDANMDARALGARVVKIENTTFSEARKRLLSLMPQDENSNLGLARLEWIMNEGLYLHGLGLIPDRNTVHYTLVDLAGKEFTLELHALNMADLMALHWVYPFKQLPLSRQIPDEVFWSRYLPDSRTIYCNFRGYEGIEKNAAGLFHLIKENHPDKVVVDLRQNGGGDYTLGKKFVIDPLRDLPAVNKKGHLFVLIGPFTFSAGMVNAAQFRSETLALLVGEPIGEKPNSFQEAREMQLPNSHLIARYSTEKYSFADISENIIRPDRLVECDWKSYQAGRDPVLEWVLNYKIN